MDQNALRQSVLSFLQTHRKAVLAACNESCYPTTSLMLYAVNENFEMHFGTRKAFGKYPALLARPFVSVTVVEEAIDPLKAVEIRGDVEFIEGQHVPSTLEWFTAQNPSTFYIKEADDFVMYKVIPQMVRWMDATSGNLVMEHLEL